MSYICHKIIHGKKYAYEITSWRDPDTKKIKKKSRYLGVVQEDGLVVKRNVYSSLNSHTSLDFGDSYFLYEFFKKTSLFPLISEIAKSHHEIIPLIIYRLCYQSAMYNASEWYNGTILSFLLKDIDLSSQHISRILSYLGQEDIQRNFFKSYLTTDVDGQENVIIDATSLPNQINHPLNAWGHSDGGIEKQFRFLCVVSQKTKMPLFYRFLPGNIIDISSLKNTIYELQQMGSKNNFILLDAGYCSEENIHELYQNNIDFLTRLPSQRSLYKKTILTHTIGIEHRDHVLQYGNRALFVKSIEENLYGHPGRVYLILDPLRKAKETQEIMSAYIEDYKSQCYWISLPDNLINFKKLKLPKDCSSCYIKIENNNKQLIYLEKRTRKLVYLPIKHKNKADFELIKNMANKTRLSEEIFNKISEITGHQIKRITEQEKESFDLSLKKAGIMILISSKAIHSSEVISAYYMRQNIEQIFGFFKDDLDTLPIRRHNNDTILGYLFLQFITLILFIQLRNSLQEKYTVEQALLITRNLKCNVFENTILVKEANKKQLEIYQLGEIVVPKILGV